MAELTNNFEGGTATNTIASTDSGSGNAWDSVTIGASSGLTYDTTHVAHGSLACKMLSGSAAATYLDWSTSMGTLGGTHYGRIYFYFTANPGSTFNMVRFLHAGSGCASVTISTTGKVIVGDTTGTKATGAVSIALNAWNRVEWQVVHSATVGNVTANLYKTMDSVSIDETIGNGGNYNTSTNTAEVRIGNPGAINSVTYWIDDLDVGNTTGYPGPVISNLPYGLDQIHTTYRTSVGRLAIP